MLFEFFSSSGNDGAIGGIDLNSSSVVYVATYYPINRNDESIATDDSKVDGDKEYSADESSLSTDQYFSSYDYTEELKLLYAGVGSKELKSHKKKHE